MKLFLMSALQLMLVSMNVVFVSNGMILPMLITAFSVSFVYSSNIKRIVAGDSKERLIYCFGATAGVFIGYNLAHFLQINLK